MTRRSHLGQYDERILEFRQYQHQLYCRIVSTLTDTKASAAPQALSVTCRLHRCRYENLQAYCFRFQYLKQYPTFALTDGRMIYIVYISQLKDFTPACQGILSRMDAGREYLLYSCKL